MNIYQPLQNKAYDYLYNKILLGELNASEVYSSTKIAQEIGISRTPMRDALQRLSQDGFIDILPGSGFRIHQLTRANIIEIAQIRCALETFCGDILAQDLQKGKDHAKETVQTLNEILDKMESISLTTKSIPDFMKLDNQFHTTMILYVNNPVFCDIYQKNLFLMEQFLAAVLPRPMRMEHTLTEHRTILESLIKGDTATLFSDIKDHLRKAFTSFLETYPNQE